MRPKALSQAENQALLREHAALVAEHGAESPAAIAVRNAIVEGNVGLVFAVWGRSFRHRVEHDDALGIGAQGLVKAIERFDITRGLAFSTYASHWIRHFFSRTVANEGLLVRVPVHAQQAPRPKSKTDIAEAAEAARRVHSLDVSPAGGRDGQSRETFGDLTADPGALAAFETIDADDQAHALQTALATLPPAEREVLQARAEGESTLVIAQRLGLTREQVTRLAGLGAGRMRRALAA